MRLLEQTPYGVMKRTVLARRSSLTLYVDGRPVAHVNPFMLYRDKTMPEAYRDAVREWVERCLLMGNRGVQDVSPEFFDSL